MLVKRLQVGPLQVNCYVIGCKTTRRALVVDPGAEGERILQALQDIDLTLQTIVNTHGHFDHIGANALLCKSTGAELLLHRDDLALLREAGAHAAAFGLTAESSPEPSRTLVGGERLKVGEGELEVIHVPGHSPGGICLYGAGLLFCGDALFAGSVGRTDLPGGDFEALVSGIRSRLLVLPEETLVYPGHGPETTIGQEKAHNPFVGYNA